MYHSLHPTLVFVDEAGMSRESDILPILAYYFTKAFGLIGDQKQLGHTVKITRPRNPFRRYMGVSLLARMAINGVHGYKLEHENRLTGTIHILSKQSFYEGTTRWQKGQFTDPQGWAARVRKLNPDTFHINANVASHVPESHEIAVGTSQANPMNVHVSLDVVSKLVSQIQAKMTDIVVSVGYDAQKREYMSELSRRDKVDPQYDWLSLKVAVIETFQGNEAPFAIFDFVRIARGEVMGHMRSFRRLNVGMTCGRFSL